MDVFDTAAAEVIAIRRAIEEERQSVAEEITVALQRVRAEMQLVRAEDGRFCPQCRE